MKRARCVHCGTSVDREAMARWEAEGIEDGDFLYCATCDQFSIWDESSGRLRKATDGEVFRVCMGIETGEWEPVDL